MTATACLYLYKIHNQPGGLSHSHLHSQSKENKGFVDVNSWFTHKMFTFLIVRKYEMLLCGVVNHAALEPLTTATVYW